MYSCGRLLVCQNPYSTGIIASSSIIGWPMASSCIVTQASITVVEHYSDVHLLADVTLQSEMDHTQSIHFNTPLFTIC